MSVYTARKLNHTFINKNPFTRDLWRPGFHESLSECPESLCSSVLWKFSRLVHLTLCSSRGSAGCGIFLNLPFAHCSYSKAGNVELFWNGQGNLSLPSVGAGFLPFPWRWIKQGSSKGACCPLMSCRCSAPLIAATGRRPGKNTHLIHGGCTPRGSRTGQTRQLMHGWFSPTSTKGPCFLIKPVSKDKQFYARWVTNDKTGSYL